MECVLRHNKKIVQVWLKFWQIVSFFLDLIIYFFHADGSVVEAEPEPKPQEP